MTAKHASQHRCRAARRGSTRMRTLTRSLDYLFIDEAGQVSLADALAMGTAARNLILVGDPQQLAQVSRVPIRTASRNPCSSTCSVGTRRSRPTAALS